MVHLGLKMGKTLEAIGLPSGSPFPVFKYLKSSDLHFWQDKESIRLGTLFEYRRAPGESGYGDPFEQRFTNLSYSLDGPSDHPRHKIIHENNKLLGISIENCYGGTVTNTSYSRPNSYVFCAAYNYSAEELKLWHEQESYDAVIKIFDIFQLISLIRKEVYRQHGFDMGNAILDIVSYFKMPLDIEKISIRGYPFIKNETYHWQKEIRIGWPFHRIDEEACGMSVDISALSKMFDVINLEDCDIK